VFERGEGFELKRVGLELGARGRADAFEQATDGTRTRRGTRRSLRLFDVRRAAAPAGTNRSARRGIVPAARSAVAAAAIASPAAASAAAPSARVAAPPAAAAASPSVSRSWHDS
jgi:hypothetical protein